jgi:hypothetical protein
MRRYRVLNDEPTYSAKKGDEVDLELGVIEEDQLIGQGRVELLPYLYKVTGPVEVYDTPTGETFEAAISQAQETALIQGGHIERVRVAATEKPKGGKK